MRRFVDYLRWLEDHEFYLACVGGTLLACAIVAWYIALS